jgi:hypothetical protein
METLEERRIWNIFIYIIAFTCVVAAAWSTIETDDKSKKDEYAILPGRPVGNYSMTKVVNVEEEITKPRLRYTFAKFIADTRADGKKVSDLTADELVRLLEEWESNNNGPEYNLGICEFEKKIKITKNANFNPKINFCWWGIVFMAVKSAVIKCANDQSQKCIDDAEATILSVYNAAKRKALE